MSEQQFWMVYRVGGRAPKKVHLSSDDAAREARRIAALKPGTTIVTLHAEVAWRADSSGKIRGFDARLALPGASDE